jgi:hypothetical protein
MGVGVATPHFEMEAKEGMRKRLDGKGNGEGNPPLFETGLRYCNPDIYILIVSRTEYDSILVTLRFGFGLRLNSTITALYILLLNSNSANIIANITAYLIWACDSCCDHASSCVANSNRIAIVNILKSQN